MENSSDKTEKQRMLAGELYDGFDPELMRIRSQARKLLQQYNNTAMEARTCRTALLKQLFKECGTSVWIEPPFFCDYGVNTIIGEGVFLNCNCVILDCNEVQIGAGTMIGPAVQIYTAYHPTDSAIRKTGRELAAPVSIGRNVWIGGGAILCPGVTVGDDSTIGAGSVVIREIPAGVIAAGNPCRVIRPTINSQI
jgi:maltose O-acetyltransferase